MQASLEREKIVLKIRRTRTMHWVFVVGFLIGFSGCLGIQVRTTQEIAVTQALYKFKSPNKIVSGIAYVTVVSGREVFIELKDAVGNSPFLISLRHDKLIVFDRADNCRVGVSNWLNKLDYISGADCDFELILDLFIPLADSQRGTRYVFGDMDNPSLVFSQLPGNLNTPGQLQIRMPEKEVSITFKWKEIRAGREIDATLIEWMNQVEKCSDHGLADLLRGL